MDDRKTEACGRCSLSAVVNTTDGDGDVIGEDRIEIEESEMRRMSAHHVAATRAKKWFDALGERLIYGR